MLVRVRPNDKKGKRVTSARYGTVIEAENAAFYFRYAGESNLCQAKLDDYRSSVERMMPGALPDLVVVVVVVVVGNCDKDFYGRFSAHYYSLMRGNLRRLL